MTCSALSEFGVSIEFGLSSTSTSELVVKQAMMGAVQRGSSGSRTVL
jgi:hypothetical protein